jgi:hypothetical protein
MNVTTGGVSKSGKSVYLQETPGGMSLVFFESAFEHFGGANGIAPRFLGKTVKVWGTNRQFQDCISLVVFAPREHQSAVCNTLPLFWRRTWQNRPNTPFFAARNPAGGVARRCCGWSHPCRDGLTTAPIVNT